jgi:hypothetical protein
MMIFRSMLDKPKAGASLGGLSRPLFYGAADLKFPIIPKIPGLNPIRISGHG